ncbi:MAG: HAMP domain-containing protein, partial [Acidobacteriota bacterium]
MPLKLHKISLVYFVLVTLLLVGVVPVVMTGWFLSDRSAKELRAAEGRYQTQLVQDKARQIEMFGQRYSEMVSGIAKAFELSQDFSLLSSEQTQQKLGQALKENPFLLTLYVKPIQGEPLSVFRSEMINGQEVERISTSLLSGLTDKKIVWGRPQLLQNGENIITIAVPVYQQNNIAAAVIGIISLREINRIMVETRPATEKELWEAGLPIIFVVDEKAHAVFHPDSEVIKSQKSLGSLKIVEEWKAASQQIQSALVPFTAEYDGNKHEMIGAYSTANFSNDMSFGVIAMQDEGRALKSVSEMRRQTWMMSLALAFVALILGFIFANRLTHPVSVLVAAAEKIGLGDLKTRILPSTVKEFNTLGNTFNSMSESLEENIAKLAKAAEENRELFVGTVKALAAAIDGKDKYTRGHSERVSRISLAI